MAAPSNTLNIDDEADLLVNIHLAGEADRSQNLVAALTQYTSALAIDPQRADVWAQVGRIYVKMDNFAQALPALETALALQPNLPQAQHALAFTYYSLGQRERACELIDQVARRSQQSYIWAMRA